MHERSISELSCEGPREATASERMHALRAQLRFQEAHSDRRIQALQTRVLFLEADAEDRLQDQSTSMLIRKWIELTLTLAFRITGFLLIMLSRASLLYADRFGTRLLRSPYEKGSGLAATLSEGRFGSRAKGFWIGSHPGVEGLGPEHRRHSHFQANSGSVFDAIFPGRALASLFRDHVAEYLRPSIHRPNIDEKSAEVPTLHRRPYSLCDMNLDRQLIAPDMFVRPDPQRRDSS
ncbi:MAG: hypothetical protein M1825_003436 [Sarcosagium campestre]|nr:MAG: hypothetical protein M1825_003436 [Sarcosagium campestre]